MRKTKLLFTGCLLMLAVLFGWSMSRNGLSAGSTSEADTGQAAAFLPNLTELTLPTVEIGPATQALQVILDVALDAGYHLNAEAPSRAQVNIRGENFDFREEKPVKQTQSSFTVSVPGTLQQAQVDVDTTLYYCPDQAAVAVCHIKSYRFRQPVTFSAAAAAPGTLVYRAQLKP